MSGTNWLVFLARGFEKTASGEMVMMPSLNAVQTARSALLDAALNGGAPVATQKPTASEETTRVV